MKIIEIISLVVILTLLISCSTGAEKDHQVGKNKTDVQTNVEAGNNSQCDASLWDHVYDPTRLKVIDPCKVLTGTIEELGQNEDGDTHMLLKLDPRYEDLLLKRNLKKKNGDLVVEVVCANAISDKKAVEACKGYENHVAIPKVGDHVKVTGSYVNDSHNDWAEIHPVSEIEKQ